MSQTADVPAVPFLTRDQIEARAQEVLRRHKLTTIPVNPLVLAHREGIEANNVKFKDDNVAGMILKEGDEVWIYVNQDDPPLRKRFTLAHELGHHFLHLADDGEYLDNEANLYRQPSGEGGEVKPTRRREIQANLFAASLLMPEDQVRRYWEERRSIEELATIFKVSDEAMGYRIASLDLD